MRKINVEHRLDCLCENVSDLQLKIDILINDLKTEHDDECKIDIDRVQQSLKVSSYVDNDVWDKIIQETGAEGDMVRFSPVTTCKLIDRNTLDVVPGSVPFYDHSDYSRKKNGKFIIPAKKRGSLVKRILTYLGFLDKQTQPT